MNFLADAHIHVSLKAEQLFQVGPVTITNSMLYGVICAVALAVLIIYAAKRIGVRPGKGIAHIVEIIIDYTISLLEPPLGSRERAVRFAPYFGVYFIFILFNNMAGLIPIVGPGLTSGETPLFRPFTADLNGTLAMSVFAIILVQILSIKEQGGKNHLKHYFSDKPWNPINFFIGLLEVFGEFTKILSLSLRLFLNTAVGEILIAVFTSMILVSGRTPLAAIPIFMFEALVAYIQAYVFTVLVGTYLGLAIAHSHDDHSGSHTNDERHSPAELRTSQKVGE